MCNPFYYLLVTLEEVIKKSFIVCRISNALDGTQNNLNHCSKELPDMRVAYGVTVDDGGASESGDDCTTHSTICCLVAGFVQLASS